MKLWLDDLRDPKDPFIQKEFGAQGDETWVKTEAEAITLLKKGEVKSISFDHDLGAEENGSGYGVANQIEAWAASHAIPRLTWRIHSQNTVGVHNIRQAMIQAENFWTMETPFTQAGSPSME